MEGGDGRDGALSQVHLRLGKLITVHGVNSKSEWQEEVAKGLALFFSFEPITQPHVCELVASHLPSCPLAEQNRRLAGNIFPGVVHDSEPANGKTAKVQEPGGPYAVLKASERFFRATNACRSGLDNRQSKDS